MALSLRLRRALALSSSVLDRHFSSISSPPRLFSPKPCPFPPRNPSPHPRPRSLTRSQSFRSSPASMDRRFDGKEPEIGPDDILFEGCDYNHWLITMDFPKDPENAPTAEEMVATYVKTAAMVFGSEEEAKKRIYACSTTTYQGFQCVMDEETSEKFRGLPGVVFILPDSYIDPVNKEYGGDKYENGVITHRPPPIQYRRQDGRQGRYGDRNRNYEQQSQGRYGDRQGNVPQDSRGQRFSPPPQGGRGFGPPPQDGRGFGPPPQDGRGFGPPPQDGRGFGPPPQDGRGFGPPPQDGRGFGPPPQDGRGFGPPPQDGRGFGPPPQDGRGFGPPPQDGRGFGPPPQDARGFGPPPPSGGRDGYHGGQRDQMPPYQSVVPQGQQGGFPPQEQRNFTNEQGGDYRPESTGNYGQGSGPGFAGGFRQGPGAGYNGDAGQYRQGPGFVQGQNSTGPVEGQWQGKY